VQELFLIHLRDADGRATWFAPDGQVVDGALAEAAAAARGRRVVVFVPAADVSFRHVSVPSRNRNRIAAAVPFLLEEQLAADVEELHFAIGERGGDERIAVAIVARGRMDEWLALFGAAGIQPAALVPETLALPYQPGAWTLWWAPDNALIRSGAQSSIALDADNVAFVLQRALAEAAPPPENLWVLDAGGGGGEAATRLGAINMPLQSELETQPLLILLKEHHNPQTAIDLLQGRYNRRERLGKLWRPWWPAAALLLVWLGMQFGIEIYQYRTLDAENERLQQEISAIYLQTFPDAKRVVNARAQTEQRLAALRGGGQSGDDFIELLAALSQPLAATPDAQVQRVSYKEGELNVALMIGDLQHLEQFKQQVAAAGSFKVEIQSATARNDRVEAQMQIKRSAS